MDAANRDSVSDQNLGIERTVRKEGGRLLSFIRTRVRNEDDAQDILQDVFGELVLAYRGLETIERVTAWLFQVARNKITDTYRRRKPELADRSQHAHAIDADSAYEDLLPDVSANPEELFLRDAVWDAIHAALAELPLVQRQAWVWHELEGLSFREMAEISGESENALRLRKHYARRSLRVRLASLGSEV
jgi:RNA polymerase sigma factor (sigma-70 family)